MFHLHCYDSATLCFAQEPFKMFFTLYGKKYCAIYCQIIWAWLICIYATWQQNMMMLADEASYNAIIWHKSGILLWFHPKCPHWETSISSKKLPHYKVGVLEI